MSRHDELLDSLVQDLQPVTPPPRLFWLGGLWFVCSLVYVVAMTALLGPVRPGVIGQLTNHPHFLLELVVGLLAAGSICGVAFQSAIPGRLRRPLIWSAAVLGLAWLGSFLVGFHWPALEPSMLGKRPHCFVETLVYALPPLIAGVYWLRRLYPLRPRFSGFAMGLAAGMLPAWYMQIACMYDPGHILRLHVLPGALVSVLGIVLVALLLERGSNRR